MKERIPKRTAQLQQNKLTPIQQRAKQPNATTPRPFIQLMQNSAQVQQQAAYSRALHHSPTVLQQKQQFGSIFGGPSKTPIQPKFANTTPIQKKEGTTTSQSHKSTPPIQQKKNNTGLPDNLKSGVENLSGYSMDDVKVHYNSAKPAQLQAHAYAQGTAIHLGPGQEKHLPHEAWHVVQQKQGRVRPTMQMKGKVNVNDDQGLEKEADIMGTKAIQTKIDRLGKETDLDRRQKHGVRQLQPLDLTNKERRQNNEENPIVQKMKIGTNKVTSLRDLKLIPKKNTESGMKDYNRLQEYMDDEVKLTEIKELLNDHTLVLTDLDEFFDEVDGKITYDESKAAMEGVGDLEDSEGFTQIPFSKGVGGSKNYAYGAGNVVPHIHVYKGGDCHLKVLVGGRIKRYNMIQNGNKHQNEPTAKAEAQNLQAKHPGLIIAYNKVCP